MAIIYINGELKKTIKTISEFIGKLKPDEFIHREDGPAVIYANGLKEWWVNGVRHRIGGPAVTHPDGSEYYFENGLLHRTNGPAVIGLGYKEWFIKGKRHRLDGPAVNLKEANEYYINNVELSPKKYRKVRKWI